MPKKPAEKSFKDIADLLKQHQTPKLNKIAKRFKFSLRDKKCESLSEYLAELCHLTEHCDYRDQLEGMLRLRDQLACQIKLEHIQ